MKALRVLPFVLLAVAGPVWAVQEAAPPPGEEAEYAYGTVAQITPPDKLVVREYDFETGVTADVPYQVDPQAIFNGVDALQQIAVDDDVDIDYVSKDGHRVATVISVEKAPAAPEPNGPNPEEAL